MKLIDSAMTRLGAAKMWGEKYAPTILTVTGLGFIFAGTVWACFKALDVPEIIEVKNETVDDLQTDLDRGVLTEKEYRKMVGTAYRHMFFGVAKTLCGPFALEILGGAFILKGHSMMLTRCAALGTLLAESLQRESVLENNIRDIYGEEALQRLKDGKPLTNIDVHGNEIDDQPNYDELHDFDFWWTSGMGDYSDNDNLFNHNVVKQINYMMRKAQQKYAGYASVNEAYRLFGALDLRRNEYDILHVGHPNDEIMDYPFEVVLDEYPPNYLNPDSTKLAPDYRVRFTRKPIPCLDLDVDAGFLKK